jgi:hypothetical protein
VSTDGSVARGAAPTGCAGGGCGAGVGVAGGGAACGDGAILRTYIDPCWPERYNRVARDEVLAPFAAQVNNGHVLNQTIWNWYFDAGTDKLNTAGLAKLDSIARTRPAPDYRLYLQAARDVVVTPTNMDKVAAERDELTARRAAAIQKYMATQPAIGTPVAYEVFVHDAPTVGIPAEFSASSFRGQSRGYVGGIGGGGGTTPSAAGTSAPPASSVGGGAPSGPGGGPTGPGPNPSAGGAPGSGTGPGM